MPFLRQALAYLVCLTAAKGVSRAVDFLVYVGCYPTKKALVFWDDVVVAVETVVSMTTKVNSKINDIPAREVNKMDSSLFEVSVGIQVDIERQAMQLGRLLITSLFRH